MSHPPHPPRPQPNQPSLLTTAVWWVATIGVLVILDDLTFGPGFWILSRATSVAWGVAAVFAIYVPAQVYLVRQGTAEQPGRLASFLLGRFDLNRRSRRVQKNEQVLHSQVIGWATALILTLVIGGVLPPLLLWRQGFDRSYVRAVSVATAIVYAAEFALLHAVIAGSV